MKTNLKRFLVFALIIALVPLLVGCGIFKKKPKQPDVPPTVIEYGDLSIHFLELGNRYAGDCIYIKYGEMDILIDAGSRQGSAATICGYLNNHVTDKLDFVIATHAHQDHIAGFYGNSGGPNGRTGVLYNFEIDTIIDYSRTNSTAAIKTNYETQARAYAIAHGATHYTAAQCFDETDGAQKIYEIGEGIEMEILYNYYYFNNSSDENDYSVCVMIRQGENQYLFTGDLEASGENHLVNYYEPSGGLGHCVLYKAGHHGSVTSSSSKLLEEITPEYVVVCCVAGDDEYTGNFDTQFPTKAFLTRIAVYTDAVYVTSVRLYGETPNFGSMNGDIVFNVFSDGKITVVGSNNSTKLKDTDWFEKRGWGAWPIGE